MNLMKLMAAATSIKDGNGLVQFMAQFVTPESIDRTQIKVHQLYVDECEKLEDGHHLELRLCPDFETQQLKLQFWDCLGTECVIGREIFIKEVTEDMVVSLLELLFNNNQKAIPNG